jgi:hypothetical protein
MAQTAGDAAVARARLGTTRTSRGGAAADSNTGAAILPLGRSRRGRPALPDPLEDPTAVAAIVSAGVIEGSGLDDEAIVARIGCGRQCPVTAALVARWRAGTALPDLPTFLQLVALAGASALGCLAGLPFER